MKLKTGDIFESHISDNMTCYGQIISTHKKDALTIIIFEGIYSSRPQMLKLLQNKILFFGNTFDAKFHHKHWIVIENITSNLANIKLPYYKIGTDQVYIEDFFENKIKRLNSNEEDDFYYRSYVAPVRFESAMKAYYKYLEWDKCYDELLYTNLLKSVKLLEE